MTRGAQEAYASDESNEGFQKKNLLLRWVLKKIITDYEPSSLFFISLLLLEGERY